ncbi:segregation and condensation protein A [Bombilactobacillus mellis]|uniref:segregation and condensation protein A n=1 Tax=Bombilactobacillus mellis TaxID=1218508 RepID=UPI002247D865|nr:segregation/condensation protein A [Bombilactobacillus mellis]MCX0278535.1 segregation/condensation protein A [Bombilactobacillus mellis]
MEKLQLVLSDFQGPLDLLLHLIRQSKIDIYNIPIAKITEQYMEYLHKMNVLQLDVAGDYLVMAATLMRIKSQLLLPQAPTEQHTTTSDNTVDPRSDLVAHLLTYQAFKSVAQTLKQQEKKRQQLHAKPLSALAAKDQEIRLKPGVKVAADLARAVADLLQKQDLSRRPPQIKAEKITLKQAQTAIMEQLQLQPQTTFGNLLRQQAGIEEVVTKFMALLELIKKQVIVVQQTDYQADILVQLRSKLLCN